MAIGDESAAVPGCPYTAEDVASCPNFTAALDPGDGGPLCQHGFAAEIATTIRLLCARRHDDRHLRALVVDDDPLIRAVVAVHLRREGIQVVTAPDGLAAETLLHRVEPDVIVTDWSMPHLDGVAFSRRVRADPANDHIPIVLFSGESPRDAATALETLTNVTYVQKGRGVKTVVATLNELALDSRSPGRHGR